MSASNLTKKAVQDSKSPVTIYANDFKNNVSYKAYLKSNSNVDKKAFYDELDSKMEQKSDMLFSY